MCGTKQMCRCSASTNEVLRVTCDLSNVITDSTIQSSSHYISTACKMYHANKQTRENSTWSFKYLLLRGRKEPLIGLLSPTSPAGYMVDAATHLECHHVGMYGAHRVLKLTNETRHQSRNSATKRTNKPHDLYNNYCYEKGRIICDEVAICDSWCRIYGRCS